MQLSWCFGHEQTTLKPTLDPPVSVTGYMTKVCPTCHCGFGDQELKEGSCRHQDIANCGHPHDHQYVRLRLTDQQCTIAYVHSPACSLVAMHLQPFFTLILTATITGHCQDG